MKPIDAKVVESTRNWIRDIVIGLNFCPFARQPFKEELILYKVDEVNLKMLDTSAIFIMIVAHFVQIGENCGQIV